MCVPSCRMPRSAILQVANSVASTCAAARKPLRSAPCTVPQWTGCFGVFTRKEERIFNRVYSCSQRHLRRPLKPTNKRPSESGSRCQSIAMVRCHFVQAPLHGVRPKMRARSPHAMCAIAWSSRPSKCSEDGPPLHAVSTGSSDGNACPEDVKVRTGDASPQGVRNSIDRSAPGCGCVEALPTHRRLNTKTHPTHLPHSHACSFAPAPCTGPRREPHGFCLQHPQRQRDHNRVTLRPSRRIARRHTHASPAATETSLTGLFQPQRDASIFQSSNDSP